MSREAVEQKGQGEEDSKENRDQERKTETKSPHKVTEGVDILLGDPEKAVIKLSIPIIVAMGTDHLQPHRYLLGRRFWCGCPGCFRFCIPFCNPDGSYRRA